MMTLLLSRWSQSPRFALGSSCCKSEGGQCIFAFFYTQNKPVFRRVPISFQPTGMVEATLVAKRAHFEVLTWQTLQASPQKRLQISFPKLGPSSPGCWAHTPNSRLYREVNNRVTRLISSPEVALCTSAFRYC